MFLLGGHCSCFPAGSLHLVTQHTQNKVFLCRFSAKLAQLKRAMSVEQQSDLLSALSKAVKIIPDLANKQRAKAQHLADATNTVLHLSLAITAASIVLLRVVLDGKYRADACLSSLVLPDLLLWHVQLVHKQEQLGNYSCLALVERRSCQYTSNIQSFYL